LQESHHPYHQAVYTSLVSPETTGLGANEKLVKQRACIAGFSPAIRLGQKLGDLI